jgi:hypothetical protein
MPSPLQNIARHTNFDRLLPSNFGALATILNIESWSAGSATGRRPGHKQEILAARGRLSLSNGRETDFA